MCPCFTFHALINKQLNVNPIKLVAKRGVVVLELRSELIINESY